MPQDPWTSYNNGRSGLNDGSAAGHWGAQQKQQDDWNRSQWSQVASRRSRPVDDQPGVPADPAMVALAAAFLIGGLLGFIVGAGKESFVAGIAAALVSGGAVIGIAWFFRTSAGRMTIELAKIVIGIVFAILVLSGIFLDVVVGK